MFAQRNSKYLIDAETLIAGLEGQEGSPESACLDILWTLLEAEQIEVLILAEEWENLKSHIYKKIKEPKRADELLDRIKKNIKPVQNDKDERIRLLYFANFFKSSSKDTISIEEVVNQYASNTYTAVNATVESLFFLLSVWLAKEAFGVQLGDFDTLVEDLKNFWEALDERHINNLNIAIDGSGRVTSAANSDAAYAEIIAALEQQISSSGSSQLVANSKLLGADFLSEVTVLIGASSAVGGAEQKNSKSRYQHLDQWITGQQHDGQSSSAADVANGQNVSLDSNNKAPAKPFTLHEVWQEQARSLTPIRDIPPSEDPVLEVINGIPQVIENALVSFLNPNAALGGSFFEGSIKVSDIPAIIAGLTSIAPLPGSPGESPFTPPGAPISVGPSAPPTDDGTNWIHTYIYNANGSFVKASFDISADNNVEQIEISTYDASGSLSSQLLDSHGDGSFDQISLFENDEIVAFFADINNDSIFDLAITNELVDLEAFVGEMASLSIEYSESLEFWETESSYQNNQIETLFSLSQNISEQSSYGILTDRLLLHEQTVDESAIAGEVTAPNYPEFEEFAGPKENSLFFQLYMLSGINPALVSFPAKELPIQLEGDPSFMAPHQAVTS